MNRAILEYRTFIPKVARIKNPRCKKMKIEFHKKQQVIRFCHRGSVETDLQNPAIDKASILDSVPPAIITSASPN